MKQYRFLGSSALRSAALAGLALGFASPVLAQDTDDTQSSDANASTDAEDLTQGEAIVVTGSRIATVTPFNSPDPVSVIDPEVAKREGKFDIASTLQSSPIAAGSTQITSAISSNFVTNGGPGAQTIDLRGLGANRTLVLLNGRRAGPAGTRGGVSSFDLNVLPQSIVDNIQILKTGASSVYGSDAVAGVVNIITKTDTDGVTFDVSSTLPTDTGGEEHRISAVWGKTWSRGHLMIAGDYTHRNELARGDRDYLACPEDYIFHPDGSRADLVDPRTGKYRCDDLPWGHVWTYNLIDNLYLDGPNGEVDGGLNTSPRGETVLMQYQYPGETLGIPAFGAPGYAGDFGAPAGWYPTGYDAASLAVQNGYHPFVEEQTIIPETDLYTIYAEGSYEVTDHAELFGEFLYNRRKTYQNGWRQFWNFGYTGDLYSTGAGNAFNYWGGGFQGLNLISPTAITNHADSSQDVEYYRGVGGLRGDFGGTSNWAWEVYGQYSRNIGRYRDERVLQDVYNSGLYQGLYGYGSCVGTVLPVSGKQCIDIPWADPYFLRGEMTPEQVDFIFDWEEGRTLYTQLTGEASVSGSLLELPAGPLGFAGGLTIRQDRINDTPGDITLAGNAWGSSSAGVTAGKSITKEAFAELSIPILADQPFFEEFTLSAAARVTNVEATRASDGFSDSDNGNWTYKVGANWAMTDWLRFRASYGTSYRAPALFEQFLADETSFPRQSDIDPCISWAQGLANSTTSQRIADNCAADGIPGDYTGGSITANAVAQGGIGQLKAETSNALVIGTILTPRFDFLPGTRINIAVDYFDIKVKGEISQLGSRNIVYGCYDSDDFANEPLCDLFVRGGIASAPLTISDIFDKFVNIARQRNSGVDVSAQIRQDAGGLGDFSLTADMTWQTKDDLVLLPGSPVTSDNGEAGSPQWVGDFRLTWDTPVDGLSAFYGMSVIGGTSDEGDYVDRNGDTCVTSQFFGEYCPDLTAPAIFYHNFSVTKEFQDRFTLTLGVNNIFDTRPPRVSQLNGGTIQMLGPVISASQYPFVGRRLFINATADF